MSIGAFTRVFDALWKSGYRFSDKDMRKTRNLGSVPIRPEWDAPERMSRKSGYRFSEKDMRQRKKFECIPVQLNRDAL
jgi:hypothetical protein